MGTVQYGEGKKEGDGFCYVTSVEAAAAAASLICRGKRTFYCGLPLALRKPEVKGMNRKETIMKKKYFEIICFSKECSLP